MNTRYQVMNVSRLPSPNALGQNKNTTYPPIPSDAPEEVLRRDQECQDLYDKLYDAWTEYYECYHEEMRPCRELEKVMDETKKKYEAGCKDTSIPECKKLYDDWYDAWIEYSKVCVDRPYSEKCAEIYYGKYWPASKDYEDCVDSLNRLLDNWRKPQGKLPGVLPQVPSQDVRTATATPRTTTRSTVAPQDYAPVATPSFQNVTTPLTTPITNPTLQTVQTPATTGPAPVSYYQEGSIAQPCPPGEIPVDPQHPEFGCRGAVETGSFPGIPGGFGGADVTPGMLSPGGGIATSFAGMGRRFKVANVQR